MRMKSDYFDFKYCNPDFSRRHYIIILATIVIFPLVESSISVDVNDGAKYVASIAEKFNKVPVVTKTSIDPRHTTEKIGTDRNQDTNYTHVPRHNTTKNGTKEVEKNTSESHKKYLIFTAVGLIIGLAIPVVILLVRKRCKSSKKKRLMGRKMKKVSIQWEYSTYGNFAEPVRIPVVKIEESIDMEPDCGSAVEYEIPADTEWEFPRQNLEFVGTLCDGKFAEVKLAKAMQTSQVAVKMLKYSYTNKDLINLVQEMEIMKAIGKHKNILEFVGCCTQNGPLHVITAYAPHGNLLGLLRKRRTENNSICETVAGSHMSLKFPVSEKDLVSYAHEIAQGMEYIESKRFIHGDLATCNILVSDHYVMKIANFGIIRDFGCNDFSSEMNGGRYPILWMAPEAFFYKKYSIQSDIWSFGILLWELMTLGETPYPTKTEIEPLLPLILSGYRMQKPPHCSTKVYNIMKNCWANLPENRPTFHQLVTQMDKMLMKVKSSKHKPTNEESHLINNQFYACVDISRSTFSIASDDNLM